jgi:hypothetical protein
MSRWIHCDNKLCDKGKDVDRPEYRAFSEAGWVTMERADRVLDFHDDACLARHLSFHLEPQE